MGNNCINIDYEDLKMDRANFEAEATKNGFEVYEGTLAAGTNNPEHTHPFHARLFVLSGQITIECGSETNTYGPGDNCQMDADTPHTEIVSDKEVVFLVARRPS